VKQIIILIVTIQIIFFFPLQAILDKQNHYKMTNATTIVFTHAQKARIEGRFTPEIKTKMLEELAKYFPRDEIEYTLTEIPKYRLPHYDEGEKIHFEVIVPIKKLLVLGNFWGISNEENKLGYKIDGVVSSELLPR